MWGQPPQPALSKRSAPKGLSVERKLDQLISPTTSRRVTKVPILPVLSIPNPFDEDY